MNKNSTIKTFHPKYEKMKNPENLEILQDRLSAGTYNMKGSELEEKTGVSDSVISSIKNGDRINPKIDNIISIAKGLNCSIDYLVGLTDTNSTDISINGICKKTNLSVEAVENLCYLFTEKEIKVLNELLTNIFADSLFETLYDYYFGSGNDVYYLDGINETISTNDLELVILSKKIESIKIYQKNNIANLKNRISELNTNILNVDKQSDEYYRIKAEIISLKERIEKYESVLHIYKASRENNIKERKNNG